MFSFGPENRGYLGTEKVKTTTRAARLKLIEIHRLLSIIEFVLLETVIFEENHLEWNCEHFCTPTRRLKTHKLVG